MRNFFKRVLKFLKSDSDESIANLYKFIGYMVVSLQIFLWSQAFWLCLIETVFIIKI